MDSQAINKQRGRGCSDTDDGHPFLSAFPDLGEPQHSALGAADNSESAESANHSDADNGDSSRVTSSEYKRSGTDADSKHDDFFGDLERSASNSADNPSAAESTKRLTFDEHYDERIARGDGDGDGGAGVSSEAVASVPSSQLGGEPSACGA